ncbi:hypothetical protein AYO50_01975 [Acidobacteria bacterium SCGC AG-212-P17]|nr:hypothetical protein AYO50_01975 [Acidobacteria bacterium SCGC AG-212-P17]
MQKQKPRQMLNADRCGVGTDERGISERDVFGSLTIDRRLRANPKRNGKREGLTRIKNRTTKSTGESLTRLTAALSISSHEARWAALVFHKIFKPATPRTSKIAGCLHRQIPLRTILSSYLKGD